MGYVLRKRGTVPLRYDTIPTHTARPAVFVYFISPVNRRCCPTLATPLFMCFALRRMPEL